MSTAAQGIVPDLHFTGSRFILKHPTIGELPVARIGERSTLTQSSTAPDRTGRTAGEVEGPTEITVEIPLSNEQAVQDMHAWAAEARGRVKTSYKVDLQLILVDAGEVRAQAETWRGAWCRGSARPELDKGDAGGQVATETFTLVVDEIVLTFA